MKTKKLLIVFLIILMPSIVFADDVTMTGDDLYRNLKLVDNHKSDIDIKKGMHALGYLDGFIDALSFAQDTYFHMLFPDIKKKWVARMNDIKFHRLKIPKEGIAIGQAILIYKKWAEKNPEKLNESARICIWSSIIEAYGWDLCQP